MLTLSPEVMRLAERLAAARGMPVDQAIERAIEDSARAANIPAPQRKLSKEELVRRMEEISARCAARPIVDPRSPNELIGYDDYGLPR